MDVVMFLLGFAVGVALALISFSYLIGSAAQMIEGIRIVPKNDDEKGVSKNV